jgi:hypothetical protein
LEDAVIIDAGIDRCGGAGQKGLAGNMTLGHNAPSDYFNVNKRLQN